MTATLDQVYSTARSLTLTDFGTLVSRLLGELSEKLPNTSDAALETIADAREAEIDRHQAATISHEDLMAFIHGRRADRGSAQQMLDILSQAS